LLFDKEGIRYDKICGKLFFGACLRRCCRHRLVTRGSSKTSKGASGVLFREGHTKLVAEKLAEKFNADLEQLIDKKKRTGPIGFSGAGKDAVAGNLTKLEPLKRNPRNYDIILIGTPSWFGNVTPAARTFIKENNLSGKIAGVFAPLILRGSRTPLNRRLN